VKLVRSGSTFSGDISEDGTTWTQTGTDLKIDMPAKFFSGLAVTEAIVTALNCTPLILSR
jgi:hypothetical protein